MADDAGAGRSGAVGGTRIDPLTNRVVATIAAGGNWNRAIATGEGHVWVPENEQLQAREPTTDPATAIAAIDPASNAVRAKIPVRGRPQAGEAFRQTRSPLATGRCGRLLP